MSGSQIRMIFIGFLLLAFTFIGVIAYRFLIPEKLLAFQRQLHHENKRDTLVTITLVPILDTTKSFEIHYRSIFRLFDTDEK